VRAVTNGQGVMLSFKGMLTVDQIHAVAEFVHQSAGT
jgi:mono/diheme cytochrome c family protein